MWTWRKSFAPLCPVASSECGSVFQSHLLTVLSLQPCRHRDVEAQEREGCGTVWKKGVMTLHTLKQHGHAWSSILCGFLGHVQWSNHVLRGTSWLLLFRAVNVGTHGAESHTACNLERLNKLLVGLRGLAQNLCKYNATWLGFTYWISEVNKNKQNKILGCLLTCS